MSAKTVFTFATSNAKVKTVLADILSKLENAVAN